MNFHIADTFTDGLARLNGDEQKAVKTTAFDLQMNPVNPGMQFHKLDRGKDKSFWSVRVSRDIRIIVHKTDASLMLCYVAHHDDAYRWAERRKLEVHPKTGAAQFVVVREMVIEIAVRKAIEYVAKKPMLFSDYTDEELLGLGVPRELIAEVKLVDEDSLLDLSSELPGEAAEALLQEATGGVATAESAVPELAMIGEDSDASEIPRSSVPSAEISVTDVISALVHPEAQRRFRLIENREELERALDFPWDKWTTFLHPAQREIVEQNFTGPARVSGSAGTGKTIVALHRAVQLARSNPDSRVLLTTFSDTLARALHTKLRRLVGNEPRLAERIDVQSLSSVAVRLHKAHVGEPRLADEEKIAKLLQSARELTPEASRFSDRFLLSEWQHIVDAFQLASWETYRDFSRLGRKTRISEPQRKALWAVFEKTNIALANQKLATTAGMFFTLGSALERKPNPPYDFIIVDESQDLSPSQVRFLAALGGERPNALFFSGDVGQRIYQQPFSWKSMGVDVRGRSRTLRVNYRTSHQIRAHADRLLDAEVADVDGIVEKRGDTVSVFNGSTPAVQIYSSAEEEIAGVATWLKSQIAEGLVAHEIAVFVRSDSEIPRARAALAGVQYKVLDERVETISGYASLSAMHLAKGLEFRAVAVMACDDEIIPLQARIEGIGDEADLREVYESERHLLYVACTRARDHLLVTAVRPQSEFLDDLDLADQ